MSSLSGKEGIVTSPSPVPTTIINSLVAGAGIDIVETPQGNVISVEQSILDDTLDSVQLISSGTNTNVTGTPTNPIINVTNVVTSITAGTNITIGGTASNPTVAASGGAAPPFLGFYYNKGPTFPAVLFSWERLEDWTTTALVDGLEGIALPVGFTGLSGYDNTGGSFNPVTGVWTVPETGYWKIQFSANVAQWGQGGSDRGIGFFNNTAGNYIYTRFREQDSVRAGEVVWDFTWYLTQNDLCELRTRLVVAGDIYYNPYSWFFSVRFVSA